MGVIASLPAAKQALKSVKHYYSLRPRSCLEFYECMRDDVIMVWQFQYVWWSTGCCATGRASTSAGTGRAVERRPAKPPLARAAPRVAATAAAEAAARWGASDNTDYGSMS